MNKKEIKSVWAAFMEVQEAKKKALDPVGKEDGDVDNDGDEDSSDEYLANRRKKVGAAMKKEGKLPPALQKAIDKKKGKKTDDDDEEVKESEESPYPSLDKKKREKKGSNLEDAGGPAAKLKGEAVEKGKKVVCPKCKGDGCDHCDGEGEHVKEDYVAFVESLNNDELTDYAEWLLEDEQIDELSTDTLKSYSKKALKSQDYHDDAAANSKPGSPQRKKHDRKLNNRIKGADKADQKVFDRHGTNESNMDRYVDALRSIPNDQIDELSAKTKSNYAAAVKKQNASGETAKKTTSNVKKAYQAGAKVDTHQAAANVHHQNHGMHKQKAAQGGANSKMHADMAKSSAKKTNKHLDKRDSASKHQSNIGARQKKLDKRTSMGENAFDIINSVFEMRERSRLESVLSPTELAGIEEKLQPNSSGTKSEPFMSTSSAGEKKFFADHEKGSEKKYEDWEETSEKDASDAGKAVKSQSPTRRSEKRQSEKMSKVK